MAESNGELKIEKGVPIPPKATGLSDIRIAWMFR